MCSQNIRNVGEAGEMNRGKGTKRYSQKSIGQGVGMDRLYRSVAMFLLGLLL